MRLGRGAWAAVSDLFTAVPADPVPAVAPPPTPPPHSSRADGVETFVTRLSTQLLHRPGRLVVACLATVLGPAVVAQAGSIGTQAVVDVAGAEPVDSRAAAPLPGDRDSWIAVAREAAATCPGLSSAVLVAIGAIESDLGLHTGPSAAGAVGPMQFLPATWAAYGADGDRDGVRDVMNAADAVHGAARLLCANGGADPDRLQSALWNYNHSDDYVREVMFRARFIPTGS